MKRLEKDIRKPPRKMVVLTRSQNEYVEYFAKRYEISASEAVRRIIERVREREEQMNQLIEAIGE